MVEPMTRRDRNAATTRQDILAAGHEIFSQRTYYAVSGHQICDQAGVTRGALQHHFGSKFGLFMAVFEGLQHAVSVRIGEASRKGIDPWEQVRTGIAAFLDACADPAYQMIVLKEGPAAIGWQRWRELDSDYYADLVRAFIRMLAPTGLNDCAASMLTATMRGTLTELSFAIAEAGDQTLARKEALAVVEALLDAFRRAPSHRFTSKPARIGIGQLRVSPSTYLDRVAAGEVIAVMRSGRVVARLQPSRC